MKHFLKASILFSMLMLAWIILPKVFVFSNIQSVLLTSLTSYVVLEITQFISALIQGNENKICNYSIPSAGMFLTLSLANVLYKGFVYNGNFVVLLIFSIISVVCAKCYDTLGDFEELEELT